MRSGRYALDHEISQRDVAADGIKYGCKRGRQIIINHPVEGKRPVWQPYFLGFLGFQRFASLRTSSFSSSVSG